MKRILPFRSNGPHVLAILGALSVVSLAQEPGRQAREADIAPTQADVRYGPHERNVIDLYLAESDQPAPLVLYIHGGGFRQGDKRSINRAQLRRFLDTGMSVAAINYRLTDAAPMPAAYLDCARALQFLRHNAGRWNSDPKLVASTGGSAGAGTSLWIAFHDNMADPGSDDPVARESTRLVCAAVHNAQCSYDPRFLEKMGAARPNFERHPFFFPFYGITPGEIDTPKAHRIYDAAAPITYLTSDDPPVLLNYSYPNEPITSETELNAIVHHPLFGVRLKERMDEMGIECAVSCLDGEGGRPVLHGAPGRRPTDAVEFIREQFEAARNKGSGVGTAGNRAYDGRRTYQVRHVPEAGISLDGMADEPFWSQAAAERDFTFPWKPATAPATEFRALCDRDFLYFTFRVHDEDLVIVEPVREKQDIVAGDRVELFFSTDPEMWNYYCLEIDPRGRVFDYRASYYRRFDRAWSWPEVETGASSLTEGYAIEGRIPLASFEALGFPRLRPGVKIFCGLYRAEFSHDRGDAPAVPQDGKPAEGDRSDGPPPVKDWISWGDPKTEKPDFHVPASLGIFEFIE